jgi:RNA polymerase sigma-70 factor (ECF subfamily)
MSLEDKECVEGVLRGESHLFERLVEKYNRMGGAIAYGTVGDFQLAEDIVQDSFLRAFQALASLRDPSKFKVWFAGIVRSRSIDAVRSRRREKAAGDLGAAGGVAPRTGLRAAPSAEDHEVREESRQKILQALAELPVEDRTVLVLKHMEGLSYREIAEVTGGTVSAVESRLFRARHALRKKLSRAGVDPR